MPVTSLGSGSGLGLGLRLGLGLGLALSHARHLLLEPLQERVHVLLARLVGALLVEHGDHLVEPVLRLVRVRVRVGVRVGLGLRIGLGLGLGLRLGLGLGVHLVEPVLRLQHQRLLLLEPLH